MGEEGFTRAVSGGFVTASVGAGIPLAAVGRIGSSGGGIASGIGSEGGTRSAPATTGGHTVTSAAAWRRVPILTGGTSGAGGIGATRRTSHGRRATRVIASAGIVFLIIHAISATISMIMVAGWAIRAAAAITTTSISAVAYVILPVATRGR